MADFDDRTTKALGNEVTKKLRTMRFCVVGCGGTGGNFAEMLVRSGAERLDLVDGDSVDESNLNRVCSFAYGDIGASKVKALKARLEAIRPGVEVRALGSTFKERDHIVDDPLGQTVRDAVYDADVVFIGTDTNRSRIAIEELVHSQPGGTLLSCGIVVDRAKGVFEFECSWMPRTPCERAEDAGYGPDDASYGSLIIEATAVAFSMLLNHLADPSSCFKSYVRRYDVNFKPVVTLLNPDSNCNTQ